jgi:hypothetical protein
MTTNNNTTNPIDPMLGTVVFRKGPRCDAPAPRPQPPSREAQRMAAAILEVLAGVRTPTDAASALGIGVPRYYIYEQRALGHRRATVLHLRAACPGGPDYRL